MADKHYGMMECPEPVVDDDSQATCGKAAKVFKQADRSFKSVCPDGHVHFFNYRLLGQVEPV